MPKEVNNQTTKNSAPKKQATSSLELTPAKSTSQLTSQKPTAKKQTTPSVKPAQKPISKKITPQNKKPTAKKQTAPSVKPASKTSAPSNKKSTTRRIIWENPSSEKKPEPIKKLKPTYKYVSKESLSQILEKFIPKQFIPTDRFAKILGIIFMIVVLVALIQFPFDKLISGDTDIVITIGFPWPFLDLGVIDANVSPLDKMNFFLDMLLYLLLSYSIDVIINFMTDIEVIKTKKERNKPQVFKDKSPTMVEQILKPKKNIPGTQ